MLQEKIAIEIVEIETDVHSEDEGSSLKTYGKVKIHSKPLITEYKMILSESRVEYKSVINYTLTIIENRLQKLFRKYIKITQKQRTYRDLLNSIHSILDFCFFIYSVAPRVNTTIKLCRTLKLIIDFARSSDIKKDDMHQVFKRVSESITFIIYKYETKSHTQVETLYLLTVMSELGKDYWLDQSTLVSYLGGEFKSKNKVTFSNKLNYFSLTVILFYIKNKKRYTLVKEAVKELILDKLKRNKDSLDKNTECLLLLLDCISCPFLVSDFKKKLLRIYGIRKHNLLDEIVEYENHWFTKWTNFEFGKELDAKQSVEVY